MEDVDMSSAELRELLLPSDLVVPDEVSNSFDFIRSLTIHNGENNILSWYLNTVYYTYCGADRCAADWPCHARDQKRPDGKNYVSFASNCCTFAQYAHCVVDTFIC